VVAVVLLGAVVGGVWAVRRRRRFYREFELEI
jgi:VanZ family protein